MEQLRGKEWKKFLGTLRRKWANNRGCGMRVESVEKDIFCDFRLSRLWVAVELFS